MRAKGIVSKLCSTYRVQAQSPSDDISEFKRVNPGFIYYAPAMKREASALVRQADIVHGHGLYTGVNFVIGGEAIRQRKPLVYIFTASLSPTSSTDLGGKSVWFIGCSRMPIFGMSACFVL